MRPDEIIRILRLRKLEPEGGFYLETYRSKLSFPQKALPRAYGGQRRAGTAIYYLLTSETFSALHRLRGDEIYHFYLGDPVELFIFERRGKMRKVLLGSDIQKGQRPQALVPAGCWQGARLKPGGRFALLGTTMSPGFDFRDFVLGRRKDLIRRYPRKKEIILQLTREPD